MSFIIYTSTSHYKRDNEYNLRTFATTRKFESDCYYTNYI